MCNSLSNRLQHCNSILDLLCVLSVLLLCMEVREQQHSRVPRTCYAFLDEFVNECEDWRRRVMDRSREIQGDAVSRRGG